MKSGRDPEEVYQEIKDIGVKDISMEVVGNFVEMYTEASRLSQKFGDVCTVKVPCTREGLKVCKALSDEGIKVNVTLIFCAAQAVLAAKAGATYVSPLWDAWTTSQWQVWRLFDLSLDFIKFMVSELRFCLPLFVVCNVPSGHGIMVLKSALCHLRYLIKCMITFSLIRV